MNRSKAIDIMREKNSQLCIGLDLTTDDKLNEAYTIIDATAEFAAAYKPNRQYWLGTSISEMQKLNDYIHKVGSFSIIDHKLSDIGSSNIVALMHAKEEGFDFITVSPFPGNLLETSEFAHSIDLGIITLVVMSNPGAKWMLEHEQYLKWASDAEVYSDGIVIGTTNHVTSDVIKKIAELFNGFVLAPGLGKQGGTPDELLSIMGDRVLFNVSRGITQAENYYKAARMYYSLIKTHA